MLEALTRSRASENTLVIVTSDNGPEITGEVNPGAYDRLKEFGHASMGPLRGTKRDAWEGGHRVPFIARWPGVIRPGSKSDVPVINLDLFPTFLAAAGLSTCTPGSSMKLVVEMKKISRNIITSIMGMISMRALRGGRGNAQVTKMRAGSPALPVPKLSALDVLPISGKTTLQFQA